MRKNKTTHLMAGVFMIGFALVFLLITGRFIYIQATGKAEQVSLKQWAQEKRQASYPLIAERGKIFDNNDSLLAYDRPTYRLYAIVDETYSKNPKQPLHISNPDEAAKQLAPLLNMKQKKIAKTIKDGIKDGKFQVEFGVQGKNLTKQQKEDIEALEIPGIYFTKDSIRYYPNGMFASHIIGFARPDEKNEQLSGVTGIEKIMDKNLKGKDGHLTYERDKYNKKLIHPNEVVQKPENGHDIYLTIDQKIQTLLEDVLSQVDEQYNPERITAIVMNPKTGEILAMGNRPSYNPNKPDGVENWYNDVISTPFEPGSTVKMFTWAAAIDSGVYNGDEYYKSGKYRINVKVPPINDHNGGAGWGSITYDEGFQRSSNVAASKLVWEKMGPETYLEYLEAFEFDEKTDIDLPNEVAGQILYNHPIEKLTTSFGQGSTMTPMQQVKAATAIANDGKMMQPYVIKKIVDSDTGEVIEEKSPTVVGEPISEETSKQMIELLDSVVNSEEGTGKPYRLKNYSVIGKTGTAEIPSPKGGYLVGKDKNIFSFLGMAPKDDPQLIMHVSVNQPKLADDESGSDAVSFVFNHVMENGLHYLNIDPDKKNESSDVKLLEIPSLVGENTESVKKMLNDKNSTYTIVGKGKKVKQVNIENSEVLENQRIIIVTDKPSMPNINGWSRREVYQLADLLELDVEVSGHGFVSKQSIAKGKNIKKGERLKVTMSSPNLNKE